MPSFESKDLTTITKAMPTTFQNSVLEFCAMATAYMFKYHQNLRTIWHFVCKQKKNHSLHAHCHKRNVDISNQCPPTMSTSVGQMLSTILLSLFNSTQITNPLMSISGACSKSVCGEGVADDMGVKWGA